ncbi:hypothetical protein OG943_08145 [Amycolatopsis sp. NBC_00345]|uniref:hypothetical protein n=1 Tax=Amycolatopsis sp. NBC_00345 TaxID=2975955 RepID=UPI002E264FCE
MHEVDSWFDLDVRIDEPTRRPSLAFGSITTDMTIDLTPTIATGHADGVDRPRC